MVSIIVFGKARGFESYEYTFESKIENRDLNVVSKICAYREPSLKPNFSYPNVFHYYIEGINVYYEYYVSVRGYESDRGGAVFGICVKTDKNLNLWNALYNIIFPYFEFFKSVLLDNHNKFITVSLTDTLQSQNVIWNENDYNKIQEIENHELVKRRLKNNSCFLEEENFERIKLVDERIKEFTDVYIFENREILANNLLIKQESNSNLYIIDNNEIVSVEKLSIKEENTHLKISITNYQKEIQQKNEIIYDKDKELDILKKRIEKYKNPSPNKDQEINRLNRELENDKIEISNQYQTIQKLNQEIADLLVKLNNKEPFFQEALENTSCSEPHIPSSRLDKRFENSDDQKNIIKELFNKLDNKISEEESIIIVLKEKLNSNTYNNLGIFFDYFEKIRQIISEQDSLITKLSEILKGRLFNIDSLKYVSNSNKVQNGIVNKILEAKANPKIANSLNKNLAENIGKINSEFSRKKENLELQKKRIKKFQLNNLWDKIAKYINSHGISGIFKKIVFIILLTFILFFGFNIIGKNLNEKNFSVGKYLINIKKNTSKEEINQTSEQLIDPKNSYNLKPIFLLVSSQGGEIITDTIQNETDPIYKRNMDLIDHIKNDSSLNAIEKVNSKVIIILEKKIDN